MIYIAFFQGINVGKHNKIEMKDLKHICESRGLKKVQTYLQNGNVIFESDEDESSLRKMLEREIMIIYNYVVPVVIRTAEEIKDILAANPFSKEEIKEFEATTGEGMYVVLLKNIPTAEKIEILKTYQYHDKFSIIGRNIYVLFKRGIRNSLLARNLHQVDIHATLRSYTIINKLCDLINIKK